MTKQTTDERGKGKGDGEGQGDVADKDKQCAHTESWIYNKK